MNPRSIIFLRHGKLKLPYRDHGEMPFQVLADLGTQKLNPPVDEQFAHTRIEELVSRTPLDEIKDIFTSPSPRTIQTAELIRAHVGMDIPIVQSPLLREIDFDLAAMNTGGHVERELQGHGIASVNAEVFCGMTSGEHCESYREAFLRCDSLFKEVLANSDGSTLCITHDFFMRVIELYIRDKGTQREGLTVHDLESTRRNTYLTGFVTDDQFASFTPID